MEKIADLRKMLGLSLAAFAKPLGCSPTHIKRMEVGTVTPDEEFINKVCEVYHVNPEYFTGSMDINMAVAAPSVSEQKILVGQRLKQARLEKGKTLKQLSELTSIAYSQLSLT